MIEREIWNKWFLGISSDEYSIGCGWNMKENDEISLSRMDLDFSILIKKENKNCRSVTSSAWNRVLIDWDNYNTLGMGLNVGI